MKFRDENGVFHELYFKTSDTLPIGSIVEFDGTDIPEGWEIVEGTENDNPIKIRKKEDVIGVVGQVLNENSGSSRDTYSCSFLNNLLADIKNLIEGSNIDDLKDEGFHLYRIYNATGTLPANYTSVNDIFIESYIVSESNYGRQILLDIRTNSMFIRQLNNNVWGPWAEINMNINISSGTAAPSGGHDGDIYFKYS